MAITCCELKWLRYLLHDLCVPQPHPTPLYCNNQTALHISSNPVFHDQTKNIEIDRYFIHDEIQAQRIVPSYVPDAQLDDIFIKTLRQSQFHSLLCKLGV